MKLLKKTRLKYFLRLIWKNPDPIYQISLNHAKAILGSILFAPPSVFLRSRVTNYMLLFASSYVKKIQRAPGGGRKKHKLTKVRGRGVKNIRSPMWGGGGGKTEQIPILS